MPSGSRYIAQWNDFQPIRIQDTGCLLASDWLKIVHSDMYCRKIDAVGQCIFNTLPLCYSRDLCASNQRQCIEQFVWEDARYIRLQVRHNENVGSTEAFWRRRAMEGDFFTFDRSPRSRQNCFKGIKYTLWYFP